MDNQKIFISGNEAMGEGAVRAGCMLYAGYPITPQNELTAYMSRRMREEQRVFIQAESEIAAINMVLGAASTGARAMTSSSSPGISLKQEGISYLAGCRLPAVIINVMRAGPGLGSIGPSQSDYFQAVKGGGHGDYHMIVLAPWSVQEAYDLAVEAFNLADIYRTPVMLLTDAIIGQMAEPLTLKSARIISTDKSWALTGAANRAPQVVRSLFLQDGILEQNNRFLQEAYAGIQRHEQRFSSQRADTCEVLLCAHGSVARMMRAVTDEDARIGIFRPVSLWPFPHEGLNDIIKKNKRLKGILTVEASFGQMVEDVRLAVNGALPVHFYGRAGGSIPQAEDVRSAIEDIRKKWQR